MLLAPLDDGFHPTGQVAYRKMNAIVFNRARSNYDS